MQRSPVRLFAAILTAAIGIFGGVLLGAYAEADDAPGGVLLGALIVVGSIALGIMIGQRPVRKPSPNRE